MIDTPDALAALVARARQADAVALDTEFVWERTYYPALGLVQLGLGPDDVHLIDAPAIGDLAALGELLADASVTKALHDATQDLQILVRAAGGLEAMGGVPRAIFDTQRAAGFVGLGATISLQELTEWATGVRLDKGETRTNWLQRPLTDKQVLYAEADVRTLLHAVDKLRAEIAARGRDAWVADEMLRYEDPELYAPADPMEAVGRLKARGIPQLHPQARTVLRHLAAWREGEAQRLDRTRRMVLPDEALVAVAERGPDADDHLRQAGLTDKQVDRFGEGLLQAVAAGKADAPEPRQRRGRPGPEDERRAAVLLLAQAFVAGRCERQGIDSLLVATKSDLRDLVEAHADGEAVSLGDGWRAGFLGDDLGRLLDGELAVGLGADRWPEAAG